MKTSRKQVAYVSAIVMSLVAVVAWAKYAQAWVVCTYKFEIDCVNDDNHITAINQWTDDVHADAELCLRPTTAWDDNLNYNENYNITLHFYVEGVEAASQKIGTFKNRAGNSNDEIVWKTTGLLGWLNYISSTNGVLSGSQSNVHYEATVFDCIGTVPHGNVCTKDIEMTVELHYHDPGGGMPPTPIDDHDTVESYLCLDEVPHVYDCADIACHECGCSTDCEDSPCSP